MKTESLVLISIFVQQTWLCEYLNVPGTVVGSGGEEMAETKPLPLRRSQGSLSARREKKGAENDSGGCYLIFYRGQSRLLREKDLWAESRRTCMSPVALWKRENTERGKVQALRSWHKTLEFTLNDEKTFRHEEWLDPVDVNSLWLKVDCRKHWDLLQGPCKARCHMAAGGGQGRAGRHTKPGHMEMKCWHRLLVCIYRTIRPSLCKQPEFPF